MMLVLMERAAVSFLVCIAAANNVLLQPKW